MSNVEMTRRFNVPEVVTKQIKIYEGTENTPRKFRFSSNMLRWMGFEKDQPLDILKRGPSLEVRAVTSGHQKVYERRYKGRKSNPTETQLEFTSQAIMQHFPRALERVHIKLTNGLITLTPIANRAFSIREQMKRMDTPLETLFALSSGIDMIAAQQAGFNVCGCLDWRPLEQRDLKSGARPEESGLLTVAGNFKTQILINEDIYQTSYDTWKSIPDIMEIEHIPILVASVQCDDFSRLKKEETCLDYNRLDNTRDMFIPLLRGIEATSPGVVVVECVEDFFDSTEEKLLTLTMRKQGYFVTRGILDARDYGGYTSRKRSYIVYSVFPGLSMPTPTHDRHHINVWDELIAPNLDQCRDVTDNKGPNGGVITGRSRLIKASKGHAPTPIKSDSRGNKDSIYIQHEGRFYAPNETIYKGLMGIPRDFDLSCVSKELAFEQIGQGIDVFMQRALMTQIRNHLSENVGAEYISPILSNN